MSKKCQKTSGDIFSISGTIARDSFTRRIYSLLIMYISVLYTNGDFLNSVLLV